MRKIILATLFLAWSNQVFSDDIDLYVKNTSVTIQRPNVLIILDNSGSMGDVNKTNSKANNARKIIIDLIGANPEVDFALQIFNYNNATNRHGGRIISGFKDLSIPANKTALLSLLDTDNDNTNKNYVVLRQEQTPLCETLYETYRYLSGGEVYYGKQNNSTPSSIITTGNYTSPFNGIVCNKEITIIYITDGSATRDTDANDLIKTLTNTGDGDAYNGNFLGVLGSWMGTKNWLTFNDIAETLENDVIASVKIHTVGFGSVTSNTGAVALLKLAARDGETEVVKAGFHSKPAGGKYHKATDAAALKTALQTVVAEVLDSSSLTSASVSANSFDRTQTLDSVYYGMFEPSTAARWQGNLKKYKIVNGVQVDATGAAAVNAAGEFYDTSKSFWSAAIDGNDVSKGGVAEMLRTTATATRRFLTDIKGTGALTDFSETELGLQYNTPAKLTTQFDISLAEATNVSDHIKWAKGIDVDDIDKDGSTTDIRPDVFGDPLHSKPIVVNYGTGNSRIVVGTNSGVLHMFEDVSDTQVTENWVYLPKEFFSNIKPLRENAIATDNKIYGLDGEITLYIDDINNNGKVDVAEDTAWLFFGLRRGGKSYYALDITTPGTPKLMWHIDENTAGFNDLGQTWSTPQVVRSAYNTADTSKLVVIFGGGYDEDKDAAGANTHTDDEGAAVYMVNAKLGSLIKKFPTGKNNGIAATIASLDSDNDALVDRLYVGDTGGNVLRIDMPDANLANNSLITLASIGGTTNADDRRFFNKPSIVRTYILETTNTGTSALPNIVKQEVPYDAILLGSGDKATPTDTDTNDKFFMIKDKYIKTQTFGASPATAVPPVITLNDLYDYTNDPFNGYPTLNASQESELLAASLKSGWHFDLTQGGEKSSAEAIVINNVVYFTTYTPASTASSCSVSPGDAWLYAVDLALGIKKYNWNAAAENRGDRIKHMGSQYLGMPTLISTPVTTTTTTTDPDGTTTTTTTVDTQGDIIVGKEVIPVGFSLQTMRTSLTIQE
ncbi:MAG: hypothetical protein WBC60_02360 [Cognaticolwellia sp.]